MILDSPPPASTTPQNVPHVLEVLHIPIPPGWEGPHDERYVEFRDKGRLGIRVSEAIYREGGLDNEETRDFDYQSPRSSRIRLRIWVSINLFQLCHAYAYLTFTIQWPGYQWPGYRMNSADQIEVRDNRVAITRRTLAERISKKINMFVEAHNVRLTRDCKALQC